MNQNGTDQHTTHQEKWLAKVEDNYNVKKKTSFYNKLNSSTIDELGEWCLK